MKSKFVSAFLVFVFSFIAVAGLLPSTQAIAAEEQVHEIYSLLPDISLSGIVTPFYKDRAGIDKAWPKTPKDPQKIRIGFTEINQSSDWFIAVVEAAAKTAQKYGFDLSVLIADNDTQAQSQHIDTFITQGVDIIVVDPVNASAPVADINRAVAAGIPVICSSAIPEDCNILTTLSGNPFLNGFETGKFIAQQFPVDKEIISTMVAGVIGSSSTESRLCGILGGLLFYRMDKQGTPYKNVEDAWLEGYKHWQTIKTSGKGGDDRIKLTVRGYGVGNWTVEGGLTATEDLCTANPDMNLLIAENDFMAAGGIKALKAAGMMDKVIVAAAADGTREGLDMIKDGELLCTGFNSGTAQGQYTIDFINAIFKEGKDPTNLPLGSYYPAGIITKSDVDQYYEEGNKFFKTGPFVFPKSISEIKTGN